MVADKRAARELVIRSMKMATWHVYAPGVWVEQCEDVVYEAEDGGDVN